MKDSAIAIIQALLDMEAEEKKCDPKAVEFAKTIFGNKIQYYTNSYDT